MLQIFFRGSKCPVADLNYSLCFTLTGILKKLRTFLIKRKEMSPKFSNIAFLKPISLYGIEEHHEILCRKI